MTPERIVFLGTADLAVPSLQALLQARHHVVAVVTQPDRAKGRSLKVQPSSVKTFSIQRGLPVLQPERARDEAFVEEIATLKPDLIIVVAYGQILPQRLLDLPRFGCVNVHTSLLPKHRGAAPIQWAILKGDSETGVSLMKMDAGLDTGDVLAQSVAPIESNDDSQSLHDRLAKLGAELLVQTLPDYVSGRIPGRKQSAMGESSYARKITRDDGRIEWAKAARAIFNQIRGLKPWPGAFTFFKRDAATCLLKIWDAEPDSGGKGEPGEVIHRAPAQLVVACGQESLRLLEVQREGGRRITIAEFLAGNPLSVGSSLGD